MATVSSHAQSSSTGGTSFAPAPASGQNSTVGILALSRLDTSQLAQPLKSSGGYPSLDLCLCKAVGIRGQRFDSLRLKGKRERGSFASDPYQSRCFGARTVDPFTPGIFKVLRYICCICMRFGACCSPTPSPCAQSVQCAATWSWLLIDLV